MFPYFVNACYRPSAHSGSMPSPWWICVSIVSGLRMQPSIALYTSNAMPSPPWGLFFFELLYFSLYFIFCVRFRGRMLGVWLSYYCLFYGGAGA